MVSKEDLCKTFALAGIQQGDVIFVHSHASPIIGFGKVATQRNLENLKNAFLESVGSNGTLIIPTFNFDFCQGKKYVHEETPSQVGIFSNYMLGAQGDLRSFHPIYSAVAIGRESKSLVTSLSNSSFGHGSLFHWLHTRGAKLVFFNVDFYYCTFIHYVEQAVGVDYRFLKQFTGVVSQGGEVRTDTFDFYARYLDRDIYLDMTRLENELFSENYMNKVFLKDEWPVRQVACDAVFKVASKKLKENPYYLLKNPPKLSGVS